MPYVFNPFTGSFDWTVTGVPTLTTGGVTFGGTSGQITQDAQNFYFDDSTNVLSVASTTTERITNGTFTGSASGWTLGSFVYSSNTVIKNANGTGALQQTPTLNLGERFELTFTISNFTAGTVQASFAGNTFSTLTTAGTYTYRLTVLNNNAGLVFTPSNAARLTIDNVSAKVLQGGTMQTGSMLVEGTGSGGVLTISAVAKSDTFPNNSRHALFQNTGSKTWLDFRFSGVNKAHFGITSSGEVQTWIDGGNGDSVYNLSNNTLISYNVAAAFGHYGYGLFAQGVNAGGFGNPTSMLVSSGGTALRVQYVTANQTLDNTATEWIADPSTAICSGVPSAACSSYTNETDCLARDAHGGCSWFAGYNCNTYNGDQSGCEGQTGCTWETASCSGFGDQSTCESYTGCSWTNTPQDCSTLDESTCGNTSGCTQNFDDCANYSDGGGDGTACNAANGGSYCSYDSGTGACTGGSWYISCSGTYDSYSCTGTYATGNCTGTYGAACSGTASCGGIDDQTNCNNESGCTWQTAITLTLPDLTTCVDRDYWVYNASSANNDVILVPYGTQQINHTTSYTLSNYKDWVHISPFNRMGSCSGLSEGTCGSTAGCSQSYSNCTWNSTDNVCEGDASCSGYGDQSSCQSATYYSGCTGVYVISQNWYVFGK